MTIEDVGPFFESNSLKLNEISNVEWEIALRKAEKHLDYRLWNKTIFGAHTVENLGVPAKECYLNYAYMSIINGSWEWKDDFDLPKQLIRIIDSRISTVVETYRKAKVKNEKRVKEGKYKLTSSIEIQDIEGTFYELESEKEISTQELLKVEEEYNKIDQFVSESEDDDFILFWDCIKEGYSRSDIAELIGKTPKQLDKIKEKFLRSLRKELKENGSQ